MEHFSYFKVLLAYRLRTFSHERAQHTHAPHLKSDDDKIENSKIIANGMSTVFAVAGMRNVANTVALRMVYLIVVHSMGEK